MNEKDHRGFVYHAHALGISGRLGEKNIGPQAASALPPIGGHSSAQWSNYQLHDYLRYDSVSTSTDGVDRKDQRMVVTKGSLKNLRIGETIRIDDVEVQLQASHETKTEAPPRFTLTTDTTYIKNLTVAGHPIRLTPVFPRGHCTTDEIRARYDEMMSEHRPSRECPPPPEDVVGYLRRIFAWFHRPHQPGEPPVYNGVTVLPLFRIDTESVDNVFSVHGNVICVRDFGYIQLGQLLLRRHEWRVTMVQVHLGEKKTERHDNASFGAAGPDGDVTCLSVGSNGGTTDPPTQ